MRFLNDVFTAQVEVFIVKLKIKVGDAVQHVPAFLRMLHLKSAIFTYSENAL